ncbi:MAG: hypothetical protein U0354_02050 [Candidatus Sericytochromatia bacterium]
MENLTIKTVFFSSPEEVNLEEFIDQLSELLMGYDLTFNEICEIFEKIALLYS